MKKKTLLLVVALLLQSTTFSLFGGKPSGRRAREAAAAAKAAADAARVAAALAASAGAAEARCPAFEATFGDALAKAQEQEQAAQVAADAAAAVAAAQAAADGKADTEEQAPVHGPQTEADAAEGEQATVVEDATPGNGVLDTLTGWFTAPEKDTRTKREKVVDALKAAREAGEGDFKAAFKAVAAQAAKTKATNRVTSQEASSTLANRFGDLNLKEEITPQPTRARVLAQREMLRQIAPTPTLPRALRKNAMVHTPQTDGVGQRTYRWDVSSVRALTQAIQGAKSPEYNACFGESLPGVVRKKVEEVEAAMTAAPADDHAKRRRAELANAEQLKRLTALFDLARKKGIAITTTAEAMLQGALAKHAAFRADTSALDQKASAQGAVEYANVATPCDIWTAVSHLRASGSAQDDDTKAANTEAVTALLTQLIAQMGQTTVDPSVLEALAELQTLIAELELDLTAALTGQLDAALAAQMVKADEALLAQARQAELLRTLLEERRGRVAQYGIQHHGKAPQTAVAPTPALDAVETFVYEAGTIVLLGAAPSSQMEQLD